MKESLIVLVEDNADDAYLAMRVIGKVCSDRVLVARDGEEACNLLARLAGDMAQGQVRLVLLDLKLPKLSGIEVLQGIRTSEALRALPVAVLTSSDSDLDQERCRQLGVVDYIYKPISIERLEQLLLRIKDA
jgi:two-component system, response regulator